MKRDDAALLGSFAVMPLEELLQWLDQTGRAGLVRIERRDGFDGWLAIKDRQLTHASSPVLEGALRGGSAAEQSAAAFEGVLDLFLISEGRFRFEPRLGAPLDGFELHRPLPFVAMEGLRLRDEWPRLDATFSDESAALRTNGHAQTGHAVHDAILRLGRDRLTLGDTRMRLGLSRPAMIRRVAELVDRGLLVVEGRPQKVDPVAVMLAQASTLLGESQYAEAAHVFRTLLASDPLDARARQLLARAEQAEERALAAAFPGRAMLTRTKTAVLPGSAGVVLDLVADGRPIAYVLLASPLREVETLRMVAQLIKSGHLALDESPARTGASPSGRAPKGSS